MREKTAYNKSGVDYDSLDCFKRLAQRAANETSFNAPDGLRDVGLSRGESAYLLESATHFDAHVIEGLGTKMLIADYVYKKTGKSHYFKIAYDTVAAIVNDLAASGASPASLLMHLAVGDASWFAGKRARDLVIGWKNACHDTSCVWGGGETSILRDVIYPEAAVLNGSATGVIRPKKNVLHEDKIKEGDSILLVASSGIHANGLTLARQIADSLPEGYFTCLPCGRTFAEALLDPTIIYNRFVQECFNENIDLHYAVNITGHGWKKLMRPTKPFLYLINRMVTVQPVFNFIREKASLDNKEMYETFNMGAGYAVYLPKEQSMRALYIARKLGYTAKRAGRIEKSHYKKIVIAPLDIEYQEDELLIR